MFAANEGGPCQELNTDVKIEGPDPKDASNPPNDMDQINKGESSEMPFGEVTSVVHSVNNKITVFSPNASKSDDQNKKARAFLITVHICGVHISGIPTSCKREWVPQMPKTCSAITKRSLNEQNEVSKTQIVTSSRPALPGKRPSGNASGPPTVRIRDAVDNTIRHLTTNSSLVHSSAPMPDAFMLSAT